MISFSPIFDPKIDPKIEKKTYKKRTKTRHEERHRKRPKIKPNLSDPASKPDLAGKRKAHLKSDGSYWKSKGTMRKEMLRNNVSKGRKKKVNDASEHLEKTEEHA